MRNIFFALCILCMGCSHLKNEEPGLKVVHWNIKELSSKKLNSPERMKPILNVLENLEFNVLSVNEIQFDLPGVPNHKYQSFGKNAEKLGKLLKKDTDSMAISFNQANTGKRARKYKGHYFTQNTSKARKHADPQNYGIYPGQYSIALLSYFPIKEEITIKDLKWREFNKDIKLSKFKDILGKEVNKDIELFDKSFTDSIIEYENKEIHIITLHTVPAYHFGNKKTPNYERNRDQLRFLEWYLTGGSDIKVNIPQKYKIKHLNENDRYIIMGDFNTSIYADNPGSKVLKRIFKTSNLWMKKPGHTHENQTFDDKNNPILLDYIAFKGLKLVSSGIYRPKINEGACMEFSELPKTVRPRSRFTKRDCYNEDLVYLKEASDHFPIWAKFKVD